MFGHIKSLRSKSYIVYFVLAFLTSGLIVLYSVYSLRIGKFRFMNGNVPDLYDKEYSLDILLNNKEPVKSTSSQTKLKEKMKVELKGPKIITRFSVENQDSKSLKSLRKQDMQDSKSKYIENKSVRNSTKLERISKPFLGSRILFVPPIQNKYEDIKKTIQQSQQRQWNKTVTPVRNDSCENCFQNNFSILINQETLCKQEAKIDVLIIISSSPQENNKRRAIRETWGSLCNHKNSPIKCVFTIGNFQIVSIKKRNFTIDAEDKTTKTKYVLASEDKTYTKDQLEKEAHFSKDIVQFDFYDSYGNLTYKTLSGLNWAVNFCASAKFIMKTDTDMLVNTFTVPFLIQKAPKTKFIGGFCWGPSTPNRNLASKWFVPFNSYQKNKFPAMCSGTGYIMSTDLAKLILNTSKNIPFFHLEDVYIALCVKQLGILPIKLRGFSNTRVDADYCFYKDFVITSHEMTPEHLYRYWGQMKSCNLTVTSDIVYEVLPFHFVP